MSQNPVQIPTASPLPGLTMVNDANNALQSLVTLLSGASAPSASGLGLASMAGVVWHNTAKNTINIRDQADSTWITVGHIDETNKLFSPNEPVTTVSSNQTVGGGFHYSNLAATAALTLSLSQSTSLWNGFCFAVLAEGGAVTLAPNASDRIQNGTAGASYVLQQGSSAILVTDGAGDWWVFCQQQANTSWLSGTATDPTSTSLTLTAASSGTWYSSNSAGGTLTVTLPSISGLPNGWCAAFMRQGYNNIVIDQNGADTGLRIAAPNAGGANPQSTITLAGEWQTVILWYWLGAFQVIPLNPVAAAQLGMVADPPPASLFKTLRITNGGSPNSQVAVTADAVVMWNAAGGATTVANFSGTASTATGGANGLDSGSVAANTWYAVWAILAAGTGASAVLLSTSGSGPAMPSGYTHKARLGWVRTDGSGNLMRTLQLGRRVQYVVTAGSNTANLPIMASGTAGSPTTPTWVGISTAGVVPPTASTIRLIAQQLATGGALIVAPNSSYGPSLSTSNPPPISSDYYSTSEIDILLESANIYWANSSTSLIGCIGWEDNL